MFCVRYEAGVKVTKEDAKQAMNEQYGGQDEPSTGFNSTYRAAAKFSNAYMLVYIRESDWNTVMCDVIPFLYASILSLDSCCTVLKFQPKALLSP